MILTSESTKHLAGALLAFQGYVSGVKRDAQNPHFRNRYATLENVIDTARPALQECGVAFIQAPGAIVDGSLEITTRLTHAETGEWMQSTMHMPLGKRDPQGAGSATTYGLRYSLMAMLGLPPTDDDDGNATLERKPKSLSSAATTVETKYGEVDASWRGEHRASVASTNRSGKFADFKSELLETDSIVSLRRFQTEWREVAKREGWADSVLSAARELIAQQEAAILDSLSTEALADVPLDVALNASLKMHPINGG
jgi:hypothetical protein